MPPTKIRLFKPCMSPSVSEEVALTLASGYIGQGPKVEEFEAALKQVYGLDFLTVNSCTSAIDLALHLCGVGPGDCVITTPMTCTATNNHIVLRGAAPVWANVDPITGLIDPADVSRKLGWVDNPVLDSRWKKCKAIIAVDFGGRICDYKALRSFGVPVIEDAAHLGPGSLTPNHGQYVALSFQAIKYLTTGDGGALHVPEAQHARAKLLRWYGLDRTKSESFRCAQNIREIGYKYHMNDIAATIGLANLEEAIEALRVQRSNASSIYRDLSRGEIGGVIVPPFGRSGDYWLFPVLIEGGYQWDFIRYLERLGIEASPVHGRNDKHEAFQFFNGPLPGVDAFASRVVCIPVGWWLSEGDKLRIIEAVRGWPKYLRENNLNDMSSPG